MYEELEQFVRNDIWKLVENPDNVNIISTKQTFKNKIEENGVVVRNKAYLVAQGYTQVEGIDFDETFAHVPRLESTHMLISIACISDLKLYQIDVRFAFLNGYFKEEVYVSQPEGLQIPHYSDHQLKLKKSLYGLKESPKSLV